MEIRMGQAVIRLVEGDIADFQGDAVVNAANDHLWMGAGVAGALKRRGGGAIEKEAVEKGPISVGETVETTGGFLAVRYVIHAAVMGQDLHTSASSIRKATKNSLDLAVRLNLRSLAFPALGTGVGGFPLASCARIMFGVFLDHFRGGGSCIHEVSVYLYGGRALEVYKEELSRFSP